MRILVFQHVAIEHPGVLRKLWQEGGHEWTTVELDEGDMIPELTPFDVLVVMGGPMDVWEEGHHPWLVPEKAAIRRWVTELGRPFLGICLGHQLLAAALGGAVGLMARPEVGLGAVMLTAEGRADPVLSGAGASFQALHWHGAEVACLPDGAVALAMTVACPIQAMRWGNCAYGIQCHIEVTTKTVEEWQQIPAYRASLDLAFGPAGAARLAETVAAESGALLESARRINAAILALASRPTSV